MEGVVALLDPEGEAHLRAIWRRLAERHAAHALAQRVPYPHLSFHVAEGYDLAALAASLAPVVRGLRPLVVRSTGLGLFTGPAPTLYLAVTRDPALSDAHARIWPAIEPAARGSQGYYAAPAWVPHITLAQLDIGPATLGPLVADLAGLDLAFTFTLDALTALTVDPQRGTHHPALTLPLGR